MDAFISATVTVGLPVEAAWTRLRRVEGWCWHSYSPRQDPVCTKHKREVTTKPFSHRRPLKNVFNDRLGSHVPVSSGLHISDFPNRIERAIILACGHKFSVAANHEVAIFNKLLLRVHQLRAGESVAFGLRILQECQCFLTARRPPGVRRPLLRALRQGRGRPFPSR